MAPHLDENAEIEGSPGTRFLDPFLSSRRNSPLSALATELHDQLPRHLRADAAARMRTVADSIVANLALLVLSPGYKPGDALAIPTAKTKPTRYDPRDIGKHLWPLLLGELVEIGAVIKHPYAFKQWVTTAEPSESLLPRLLAVSLADIDRRAPAECIWLSARSAASGLHGQPAPKELWTIGITATAGGPGARWSRSMRS